MSAVRKWILSTSSNSQAPDPAWPEHRHWFVGAAVGLALLIALQLASSAGDGTPELRLAASSGAINAQVVDADHRILILNANSPRDARAVIGRLNQPWETRPATVIVGADRGNAEALWEAIQRLEPHQIIVAGAPGDSVIWSAIERHAREHAIDISYLDDVTMIALDTLTLALYPPADGPGTGRSSYVEVMLSESRAVVGLAGLPRQGRYRVIASEDLPRTGLWGDLLVSTPGSPTPAVGRSIVLNPGERIDAALEPDRIRISGRPARTLQGR